MKLLFLFLGILLPNICQAVDFEVDGNYYNLISTSERTVCFCGTSNQGEIIIPSKVTISNKEFTVVDIEDNSFMNKPLITSVSIPETITELGGMQYGSFSSVRLPLSLKKIKGDAFLSCKNLKEINIPENVKSIGSYAFCNCASLTKIQFPAYNRDKGDSYLSIGEGAFGGTLKHTECLSIPGYVYLEGLVFGDCSQLDSLIFEDGGVFSSVIALDPQEFGNIKHLDYIYAGREPYGWYSPPVRKVEYGDKCEIVRNPFDSGILEEIIFGKGIKDVNHRYSTNNLRNVIVRSTIPPKALGFSNDTYIHGTLFIPVGTLSTYQNANVWKEFWNIVEYGFDDPVIGDANRDGLVDVADITKIAKIILSTSSVDLQGDVNGDGSVDVADITAVANMILSGNLIANGDFETWSGTTAVGWQSSTTASTAGAVSQSTDAHTGSYSAEVSGAAAANKRIAYKEITLAAGTYNIKFWAKSTGAKSSVTLGYVAVVDGKVNGSYQYTEYVDITNEWTEVSKSFTLAAQTTVNLVIMNSKNPGVSVLIDDYVLTTSDGGIIGGMGGNPSNPVEDKIVVSTVADFLSAPESTYVWYELTGTISNLWDDLYGNFDLTDATASVYVYGLLSEKGGQKKQFQELVTQYGLKDGSKITLRGNRGSYNGKVEVTNAYLVSVQ